MRAHLVAYVPVAAVPTERTPITDLGELADSAVREMAADMLRLWEGPDGERGERWGGAVDGFNDTALHTVAGPTQGAVRALERLAGCEVRIRRAPADGHAPSLELTGGARLLLAVERWLGVARPTPRTVQLDIDPDTRAVTVRVFAESVGDLLAWARRASGTDHEGRDDVECHYFLVSWDMDVNAPDTRSAALQALTDHRDPHSGTTVFQVFAGDGSKHTVDLSLDPDSADAEGDNADAAAEDDAAAEGDADGEDDGDV